MTDNVKELGQFHTPLWVAERLIEIYFADLSHRDSIIEPSCGRGRFLQAIPENVPAIGIEIDPALAREAHMRSGRRVIVGDFCTVDPGTTPTAIIGNPPFSVRLITKFLNRAHELLPEGGRVGFILPCYAMQTTATVVDYMNMWSMRADMIPRNCFHRKMRLPLSFVVFSKDKRRELFGFALYHDTLAVHGTRRSFRAILNEGRPHRSAWRAVVEAALESLGGEGDLSEIYELVSSARPTANPFWHEKVRQIAQHHCERRGPGRYALPAQLEAA